MDSLAKRIEFLVSASGIKAKPLSKLCKLGETHLGMMLRGEVLEPDRATCERIASTTGCSWLWVMHGATVAPGPNPEFVRATVLKRAAEPSEESDPATIAPEVAP